MNIVGPKQRLSTRLAFLASGLAMSAWAPLVPFAKQRLALGEAELGLLLLCLGAGSLIAMPVTGLLTARYGCRPLILMSGVLTALILPGLAFAPTPMLLGLTLLAFGAAMGTLDVSMNVQAVIVERESGGSLMSGFHGLFSVGGFIGAGLMALMLWGGMSPLAAAIGIAVLVALSLFFCAPHLLAEPDVQGRDAPLFVMPHGAVIFIGVLAPSVPLALVGFVLIGLGASNIVPILFTAAGNQKAMPASLAIAAITTLGYAGILAGPALIGFVAHAASLNLAFACLGCAMLVIAASAKLGAARKA